MGPSGQSIRFRHGGLPRQVWDMAEEASLFQPETSRNHMWATVSYGTQNKPPTEGTTDV